MSNNFKLPILISWFGFLKNMGEEILFLSMDTGLMKVIQIDPDRNQIKILNKVKSQSISINSKEIKCEHAMYL